MIPILIALVLAVTALLWWAARPLNRNHAEDEAASRGGFTHERTNR